jgi:isocitrate dehydrogenase
MVIFRENSEDIYAGIEFEAGSDEAKKFIDSCKDNFPDRFDQDPLPRHLRHRHQARLQEGTKRSSRPRSNTPSTTTSPR